MPGTETAALNSSSQQGRLRRWHERIAHQQYLFIALVLFLLSGPLAGTAGRPGVQVVHSLTLTLVFLTGPLAVSRNRVALYATGFFAISAVLVSISSFVLQQMHPFALGLGFVFFAFLSALLLSALCSSQRK